MDNHVSNAIPSAVYVFTVRDHLVKVGRSLDPLARSRALGSILGHHIEVAFATDVRADASFIEAYAHRALKAHHVKGEWFDVDPAVAIEVIQRIVVKENQKADSLRCVGCLPERLRRPRGMTMTFRRWRTDAGLTQAQAARALGLSIRSIKYLDKGVNARGDPYEPSQTIRNLMAMLSGDDAGDQLDLFGGDDGAQRNMEGGAESSGR